MADRELNYKVGLDTNELRSQLMNIQTQVNSTVNQTHQAMQNATGHINKQRLQSAAMSQVSQNLPDPMGEPFGVGKEKYRARQQKLDKQAMSLIGQGAGVPGINAAPTGNSGFNARSVASQQGGIRSTPNDSANRAAAAFSNQQMRGGFNYQPSLIESGMAAAGQAQSPIGISQEDFVRENREIFGAQMSDLAEQSVIGAAGGTVATVGYLGATKGIGGAIGRQIGQSSGKVAQGATNLLSRAIPGGAVGRAAGSVMRGIGSTLPKIGKTVAPHAIGIAAATAGFNSITGGMEDVATERGFEQQLDQLSPNFITSDMRPSSGGGFQMEEREQIASFLNDFSQESGIGRGGASALLRGGTEIGRFRGVETVRDFEKEFKSLVSEVQEITESLRMTVDEGLGTLENFRSMGIDSPSEIRSTTRQIKSRAGVAGQTSRQMLNRFQQGAKMFQSAGLDMKAGGNLMTNIASNVQNRVARGDISPVELRQQGGVEGMIQNLTSDVTRMATQSGIGTQMAAAFAGEDMENIDNQAVSNFIESGGSPNDLLRRARENLSNKASRSAFLQNKKELQSKMLKNPAAPIMMANTTAEALDRMGLETNRSNMKTMLNNFGVQNPEQFLEMSTNTDSIGAMLNQERRLINKNAMQQAHENRSQRPGLLGQKLKPYKKDISQTASSISDYFSSGLERLNERAGNMISDKAEDFTSGVYDLFTFQGEPEYQEVRPMKVNSETVRQHSDKLNQLISGKSEIFNYSPDPTVATNDERALYGLVDENSDVGFASYVGEWMNMPYDRQERIEELSTNAASPFDQLLAQGKGRDAFLDEIGKENENLRKLISAPKKEKYDQAVKTGLSGVGKEIRNRLSEVEANPGPDQLNEIIDSSLANLGTGLDQLNSEQRSYVRDKAFEVFRNSKNAPPQFKDVAGLFSGKKGFNFNYLDKVKKRNEESISAIDQAISPDKEEPQRAKEIHQELASITRGFDGSRSEALQKLAGLQDVTEPGILKNEIDKIFGKDKREEVLKFIGEQKREGTDISKLTEEDAKIGKKLEGTTSGRFMATLEAGRKRLGVENFSEIEADVEAMKSGEEGYLNQKLRDQLRQQTGIENDKKLAKLSKLIDSSQAVEESGGKIGGTTNQSASMNSFFSEMKEHMQNVSQLGQIVEELNNKINNSK